MRVPDNGGNGGRKRRDYEQSKFKKGKNVCLVCDRTEDWKCRVTEDEGLGLCSYKASDKKDIFGRYIHILRDSSVEKPIASKKPVVEDSNQAVKADADRLDKVYSALLENLELTPAHRDNLVIERGLDIEQVVRNMYATVPNEKEGNRIAEQLSESFDLEGVPGFYLNNNKWRLSMTYIRGFYVPFRDEKSRIIGLQIRRDVVFKKKKYAWLSSSGQEKGVSSGISLHYVNVEAGRENKDIYLTEGALKADIMGLKDRIGIIATAGVTVINPTELLSSVSEVFPDLERIVLAYDMDWQTNNQVKAGLLNLLEAVKEKFVKVYVATWDRSLGKGIDDVITNENYNKEKDIKYIPANEFWDTLHSFTVKEDVTEEVNQSTSEVLSNESLKVETHQEVFEEFEQKDFTEELVQLVSEVNQDYEREEDDILYSWGELSKLDFDNAERVVFGLMRGNMGMMVASTNIGKTTLALNLALSATAGKDFYPLLNQNHTARKILYIDGEATKAEFQSDVKKMLERFTTEQVKSVDKNLFVICDEELDGEPLDLVNESHFELIKQNALSCKPDLIIVDTLSALMEIEDENDNAKVKKEVIKPLKKLAKLTNSAVLLLHHTGKYNEGSSPVGAYKGRGASAFGALSRAVITLEKSKSNKNRVDLSSPKSKGDKFDKTVLELDVNSRWFRVVGEVAQTKKLSNYEQVIEFVKDAGRPVKRKGIEQSLNIPVSSLTGLLSEALKNGDLIQPDYGYYSIPDFREPNQEIPLAE